MPEKSRSRSKRASSPAAPAAGESAVDRLVHEKSRLAILCALVTHEALTFRELKTMLNTTDGNMSLHARKLEDAGYVACEKRFEGRVPQTRYSITEHGREALRKYVDHLKSILDATRRS